MGLRVGWGSVSCVALIIFATLLSTSAIAHGDNPHGDPDRIRITAGDAPDPVTFSSGTKSTMSIDAYVRPRPGLPAWRGNDDDDEDDGDCEDDRRHREHRREFLVHFFYTIRTSPGGAVINSFEREIEVQPPYEVVQIEGRQGHGKKRFIHLPTVAIPWNGLKANGTQVQPGTYATEVYAQYIRVHSHGRASDRIIDVSDIVRGTITVTGGQSTNPPVLTVTSPANNAILAASTVTVTGTVTGQTSITANGQPVTVDASGAFSVSVPLGAEGNNTVTVIATNGAGSTQVTRTVLRDTIAPTIVVTTPSADGPTNDATPDFGITYTDGSGSGIDTGSITATLDGAAATFTAGPTTAIFTPATLTEGQHVLVVRIRDRAGNTSAAATRSTFVDTRVPVVTLSPANGATVTTGNPTLRGTFSDSAPSSGIQVASVRIELDGQDVTATATVSASEVTFTPSTALAGGTHTWRVQVADGAQNIGFASASFFVNTNPPALTVTSPANNAIVAASTVTVTGTVTGQTSLTANGQPVTVGAGGAFSVSVPLGVEGNNTITVIATNNAGSTQVTRIVVRDTIAPTVTVTTPSADGPTGDATPDFVVTYSDTSGSGIDEGSVTATLDGTAVIFAAGPTTATFTSPTVTEGQHVLVVHVRDRAGNISAPATRSTFVDTKAPVVALTPADGANIGAGSPTLRATFSDPSPSSGIQASTVRIELDNQDVTATAVVSASEVTFTPSTALAEGSHTWRVRVADGAQNAGTASASFFVDTRAPVLTATPSHNTTLTSATTTLRCNFDDTAPSSGIATSSFTATIDGQLATSQFTVTSSGAQFTPATSFEQGSHDVVYSVRDRSGNQTTLATHFFIDSVPPLLTLSPPNGKALSTNQPTLSATFVDPSPSSGLAQVRLFIDGSDQTSRFTVGAIQATYQVPQSAALSDGSHVFAAHASDNAGNSANQQSMFVVDTTPPTIAVVNPSNGSTIVTSSPLLEVEYADSVGGTGISTPSFEALLDGVDRARDFQVGPTTARLQIPTSALLAQGSHQLAVAISDGVGHRSAASITFTVETPVTGPTVPANAGRAVGMVVDAASDQPVPGAQVAIEGLPGTILTDAQGQYVFPAAPGSYMIAVTKPGYAGPIHRPVVIEAERDVAVAVVALVLQDSNVTPVTAASGGTVTNSAGTIRIELPPGSITQDAQFRITPLTEAEALPGTLPPTFLTGMSFDVNHGGAELTQPVTVVSANSHHLQPGHRLVAMAFEEETQTWECIGTGQVSADGGTVVGHISHLSVIGYT